MRHPKLVIAGVGLAVAAGIGGITAAAATSSPGGGGLYGGSTAPARAGAPAGTATVHAVSAAVGGKTEQILVNAQGLPLYYYRPDTATKSLVDGGLASLWPPLTSANPSGSGVTALTAVHDTFGSHVAYRGHLLYTFTSDRAGQVTGQGFQNFFVATPGLTPLAGSSAPTAAGPAAIPGY